MPDPNLLAAAEKINAVLAEHDLAAIVILQGPKSLHFVRKIDPTWSCAWFTEPDATGAVGVRLRAKREDFPSKDAHKACVEATTGMFLGFHHQLLSDADMIMQIITMLAHHFPEIAHNMILEQISGGETGGDRR